jgi:hypothetical protein
MIAAILLLVTVQRYDVLYDWFVFGRQQTSVMMDDESV